MIIYKYSSNSLAEQWHPFGALGHLLGDDEQDDSHGQQRGQTHGHFLVSSARVGERREDADNRECGDDEAWDDEIHQVVHRLALNQDVEVNISGACRCHCQISVITHTTA
jgi:hypothetical protein